MDELHPDRNLILPTSQRRYDLLVMIKDIARCTEIECGWCANCKTKVKGERHCEKLESQAMPPHLRHHLIAQQVRFAHDHETWPQAPARRLRFDL